MDANYGAIVVAALVNMVIGAVWYSPMLFSKPWMKLTGKTDMNTNGAGMGYGLAAVASLVIAWALDRVVLYKDATTFGSGVEIGLMLAIGLVATAQAANYVFEGRPWKLWAINVGYSVVGFAVMAGLLAAWR